MKVLFGQVVSGGPGPAPVNTLNHEQLVQRLSKVRELSPVVATYDPMVTVSTGSHM